MADHFNLSFFLLTYVFLRLNANTEIYLDELRIPASAFDVDAQRVVRVGTYSADALTAYTDDQYLNFFHFKRDSQGRPQSPPIVDRRLEAPLEVDVVFLEQVAANAAVVCDRFRCRFCNASSPKSQNCLSLEMKFAGNEMVLRAALWNDYLLINTNDAVGTGQLFLFKMNGTNKSELRFSDRLIDRHLTYSGFANDGYFFFLTHKDGSRLLVVKPNATKITQMHWELICDPGFGFYKFSDNLQTNNIYLKMDINKDDPKMALCEFNMNVIAKKVMAIDWKTCVRNDSIERMNEINHKTVFVLESSIWNSGPVMRHSKLQFALQGYICQSTLGCPCAYSGTIVTRSSGPFFNAMLSLHTEHYVFLFNVSGSIAQIEKRKRDAAWTMLQTRLPTTDLRTVTSDGFTLAVNEDDIILVFMSCGNLYPNCTLPSEDSSNAKCAWCEFANGTGASFRASDGKYCRNDGDSIFQDHCPPTIEAVEFLNDTNIYNLVFDHLAHSNINSISICDSNCILKSSDQRSATCEPQNIMGGKCDVVVNGNFKNSSLQGFSRRHQFFVPGNSFETGKQTMIPTWIIIVFIILVIGMLLTVVFISIINRLERRRRRVQTLRIAMNNVDSKVEGRIRKMSINIRIDIRNQLEIDSDNLSIHFDKELGRGAFAFVCRGSFKENKTNAERGKTVAVKFPIETKSLEEIEHELEIMALIGHHPNIIQLYGFIDDGEKAALVMEIATMSLLQYVKQFAADRTPSGNQSCASFNNEIPPYRAFSILKQISSAMSLLASKNLIHRDLAARNILLTDQLTPKISDFGLCCRGNEESSYYMSTTRQRLPVRWMSIEALYYEKFSEKSDVWSFGVLMYEIYSGGAMPYQGVANTEIRRHVGSGNRLEKPEKASDEIYELMSSCWSADPHDRPTFNDLYNKFAVKLESMNESQEYYLSATDD